MAINTLTLAERLTTDLDKLYVQKAKTGFFADNAMRSKFVGAGTVLIPEAEFSGLGDYDRDLGFPGGSVTVAHRSYDLTMDRGREFQLDAQDIDEIGIPGMSGQVMGEFVRTKVIPESDAYVLSKLAALAVAGSHTVSVGSTSTLAADIYSMFIAATSGVQDYAGDEESLVCFVNSTVWAAIMNSTALTRSLVVSDFKNGDVNLKVKSINDVAIIPVSSARMKTAYTFYDGKTDASGTGGANEKPGGFVPTATADDVGMLIMPKNVASLVRKTEKVRVWTPDQNQDADAWKFQYRLYYDLIVKNSKKDSIFAYTY